MAFCGKLIDARPGDLQSTGRKRLGGVRVGLGWIGLVWVGSVRFGLFGFGLGWFGLGWLGSVWVVWVWVGLVWFGLAWVVVVLLVWQKRLVDLLTSPIFRMSKQSQGRKKRELAGKTHTHRAHNMWLPRELSLFEPLFCAPRCSGAAQSKREPSLRRQLTCLSLWKSSEETRSLLCPKEEAFILFGELISQHHPWYAQGAAIAQRPPPRFPLLLRRGKEKPTVTGNGHETTP